MVNKNNEKILEGENGEINQRSGRDWHELRQAYR